ncbi:MAG: beta-ketoacyl-ACP synthase III [Flavobacteriaceae bacterium]
MQSKPIKAAITAVGGYVPEDILDNAELEKMVETSNDWIVSRTGIQERRILKEPGLGSSYMALKSIEDLQQKVANWQPETIDLIIYATITPDMPLSATAAYIASEIGAPQAFGYDLTAACSGFLYGLSTAAAYIESGRYQKVLVIGADKMSSIVDYQDRTTCVLFGDGAGAVLMEASPNEYGWEDEILRVNGEQRMALTIKAGGSMQPITEEALKNKDNYLVQEGRTVYKMAVSGMCDVTQKILTKHEISAEQIAYVVPHQANLRIIEGLQNRLGLSDQQILKNIQYYGNTTAATLPLVLNDFHHQFKKGDKIVLTAFGGGFTWGAAYMTWAY